MKHIMHKRILVALMGLSIVAINCSSTEKKEVPTPVVEKVEEVKSIVTEPEKPVVDVAAIVDAQNEKLAGVSVMALPPFKAPKNFGKQGERTLDAVKAAVAELPEGYVLQITGHHNKYPQKGKVKNKGGLSLLRAKHAYDYFVSNGVPKEKLSYRGVGSSEGDSNLTHAQNRRITFKIVKSDDSDS